MAEAGAVTFLSRADVELRKEAVRGRIRRNTEAKVLSRAEALDSLVDADGLRDAARALRLDAIAHLPELLEEWATKFQSHGGQVHWATDAGEAVDAVLDIVRGHGARLVSKGKSMASEEIHLNPALEAAGVEVVETDLGEFIIQLAGETPSHIIAPAIHHDRYSVAELFSADAGEAIPPEIDAEARYAQRRLRQAFLSAGVGISGVNFAIAENGTICLVENEGNGRMTTAVPRVHVAIMGMERIVRDLAELDVMLGLIARVGTGQAITVYTNIIAGPRQATDADGPDELHVVVVDNGRSRILGTRFEEVLSCIRCGACLNACPVYRQVGGHAYGSVYSGPIGAVLTPLLHPEDKAARELSEASSLCGACWDACPVRIPLHDLLLELRRRDAPGDAPVIRRAAFSGWSWLWGTGAGYALSRAATTIGLRLARGRRRLPGWAGAWLRDRELPTVGPGP